MDRPVRWPLWASLTPIVAGLGLAAGWFWFVCDDAYISFRYARHLAQGHGLRFNLDEATPVEGFSNLLWVLIAAALEATGLPPAAIMPALSVGLGAALVVATALAAQRLGLGLAATVAAALTLAAAPGMVVWSTGGLETMAEALLLFVLFDRLVLADVRRTWVVALLAGVLLCLVRTEGVGWAVVVLVLAALRHGVPRPLQRAGAGVLLAYALYSAWRLSYFGSLVSNIARVKVEPGLESAARGLDYVLGFWVAALAPLPQLLLGLTGARDRRAWLVLAMAAGVPLYAVVVGGDFMTMGRLLVPGLPFLALGVGMAVQRLGRPGLLLAVGLAAAGTVPLYEAPVVPVEVLQAFRVRFNTRAFRTEYEQWRYMKNNARAWTDLGKALRSLDPPGEAIVLGAIGAVGYYSELKVYDRFGLVSPEVVDAELHDPKKRSPGHDKSVPITFFLDREPTFLRAELASPTASDGYLLRRMGDWPKELPVREGWGPDVVDVDIEGTAKKLLLLRRMEDPTPAWATWEIKGRAERQRAVEARRAAADPGSAPGASP